MPDLSAFAFDLALTEPLQFILGLGGAVGAALIGGAIAVRLGQPAIVGYLLAGVAIGPFTPGFVGDVEQISALADVGVILLLFALGVEFAPCELQSVRRVALPGGVLQVAHRHRAPTGRLRPLTAEAGAAGSRPAAPVAPSGALAK